MPHSRPPSSLLLAVAAISAAVLGFEVALTRVFAVLLRYHFAFLVISIAVCGLGVGGYAAFWLRRRGRVSLPVAASCFALTALLALIGMLEVVFAKYPDSYWLAAVFVLVPFSCAGAFLAEAFARCPSHSGRLYAWDLAGAALTAFAVVGVLQVVSAIDACVLMAALGVVAGVLGSATEERRGQTPAVVVLLLTMGCFAADSKLHFLDIPPVPPDYLTDPKTGQYVLDEKGKKIPIPDNGRIQPLFNELGTPNHSSTILETRWSAFARTDVVFDKELPNSRYLYTNGNVPTNMMQWDGKLSSVAPIAQEFPLSDWAFDVAPLGQAKTPKGDVLAIGPGGGLDALMALYHGAAHFDGAEINPSIVHLMNEDKYAKYNGGIYRRPEVNIKVADGRAFVREAVAAKKQYALLFSALTKTATAGQGMALLESFIYTTDAFSDYMDALSDDGQITVVLDNPILTARFFVTALQVLKQRGVTEKAAMDHIAIVYSPIPGPYVYALVVKKKPFTRAQTFDLEGKARARRLEPLWIPKQTMTPAFGPMPQIAEGQLDLDGYISWWLDTSNTNAETPLDLSPCPDDRPFVLDNTLGVLPMFKQLTIFALALALVLLAVSWQMERKPLMAGNELTPLSIFNPQSAVYVLYFLALGVGFMLVEIPLTQKLILPLGYPTLALTVILFSILLGGGAGSWFSQRHEGEKVRSWAVACALGVAIYTAGLSLTLPFIANVMLPLDLPVRCVLAVLLLLPLGFLLGTPFPSGMRLFSASFGDGKIPLIWGLNGVASVVGSLLAAMGAKMLGFGAMLSIGALIYILAAGLLRAGHNQQSAISISPDAE